MRVHAGKLAALPVRSIVRAVADAASRWTDGDFPPRVRVLPAIAERTGYTTPVVEYALDRLFGSLHARALTASLVRELGSLDCVDGFAAVAGCHPERALPAGNVCVISSRTTIGVSIVPAIFALLAKCNVVVKDREDALVGAFFATLAQEREEFAEAAVALQWHGELDAVDLGRFDVVVAFGSDETLATIRSALRIGTRFVPFGSKASIGYVTREALGGEASASLIAQAAARDLVLYETQGCLSLHALFVEDAAPVTPSTFARLLAQATQRAAVEFPAADGNPQTFAALAAARDVARFRASGATHVHSDPRASFLIEFDPPLERPPAFLPRAIGVHPVTSPEDASAYVARHALPIEALAVAMPRADLAELAARVGASRIARFGELQSPPAQTRHGGRPRAGEFVRWIVDETNGASA